MLAADQEFGQKSCAQLERINCCGCSSCALACPTGALVMQFGRDGYRPHIDYDRCVNCGACTRLCQIVNPIDLGSKIISDIGTGTISTCVAKDTSVLKRSSSGGVAFILAKKALSRNLCSCGVTYSPRIRGCEHIVCNTIDDVSKTQGSKYLQSATYDGFKQMLALGRGVVFGTPCQIAGFARLLEQLKLRDSYLLVDIFCHGVPNQLVWDRHLAWLVDRRGVSDSDEVSFREGKHYLINAGQYSAWYNEDAYYTCFLKGLLNNRACYECRYRRKSCADIRLGDCQIDEFSALSFSPSCVISLTEIGDKAIDSVSDELEAYPISFGIIDRVQDRENPAIPKGYAQMYSALVDGAPPEGLIKRTITAGRIKSLIKNHIIGSLRRELPSCDFGAIANRLRDSGE